MQTGTGGAPALTHNHNGTGGAPALTHTHNGTAPHRPGIMSDTNNDTDAEGDEHMRETEDMRENEDKSDEDGDDSDTNTKRMGGNKVRKPHLQGRFSGRLETKADEKHLADECKLLGHLLGGVGKRGEKSRLTLAKIVRGIASGDVRRHCEQREQLVQVSNAALCVSLWTCCMLASHNTLSRELLRFVAHPCFRRSCCMVEEPSNFVMSCCGFTVARQHQHQASCKISDLQQLSFLPYHAHEQ